MGNRERKGRDGGSTGAENNIDQTRTGITVPLLPYPPTAGEYQFTGGYRFHLKDHPALMNCTSKENRWILTMIK